MAVKQCLVLPIFWREEERSLDAFCAQVADMGYAAIELMRPDENVHAVVATAHRHGLAVASMVGHQSLPDGLNKAENHDRIEGELRASIDLAAELGIGGLICFSGNRNPRQSDYEGLVTCAQGLRRVAPYAEAKGVNLNMELLNSKVDHPGYQCDHVDWGVTLCEMVGSPRVKLLFDIYHMQIMEGDVIRSIRKAIQHIGHFHTAGNPGRRDPDDTQELNYRGICAAIEETGYAYYVGHEFLPKGDRMEALQAAYTACGGA
ncbi:MAG: TIM barrel protein [Anaerolineae bacterium]|nr:TIM barrel protein [Anaerolineae bacterium]